MNRRQLLKLGLSLALASALPAGCGGALGEAVAPSVAQAAVPRTTAPDVSADDLAAVAAGNSAFAFDLYRALRGQEGNLFYSPYSISLALAMAYAGARGQTAAQMAETLHYSLAQERLHPAFNALDLQLASRGAGAKGQDGKGFRLRVANSVWGQSGYQFLPAYLDVLARNYGAGLRLLDFRAAPEPARTTINGWVKEQTEGKITDLLPKGSVSDVTRLLLVNAIYFNAAWKYEFLGQNTHPAPFTLLDGRTVEVPVMGQKESLRYAEGDGYQAVELPYDGDELALVVLLPAAGDFAKFEAGLSADRVAAILGDLATARVSLGLPKFNYDSTFGLAKTLADMGMPGAFVSGQADFSAIAGNRELFISDVIHEAIVAVNEKGTEAAAATAVPIAASAMPGREVVFLANRPFVFLIHDLQTGAILFVGRVLNPAA